jgi:hypothetical protein
MNRLRVKCAGGSIAQLLALAAAIKVGNLIERDFELDYFPSSTGTYWPFAIESLLKSGEFCEANHQQSISIAEANAWEIGKPIPDSIVFKPGLNYENFLEILRASKVDRPLRMLRAEYVIGADYDRLIRTPRRIRSITGGYPPFIDDEVFESLKERFNNSNLVSPFSPNSSMGHSYGVIHYRLGDQRMSGTIKKPGLGTPLDPRTFAKIVESSIDSDIPLYVCSDEPTLAKSLLESQGVNVNLIPKEYTGQGIWGELQFMAQAEVFVGSWSQVSQFASLLVSHRGGQVWYPNSPVEGGAPNWKIPGINMFDPLFLSPDSNFFKSNYGFGEDTHIAYGKQQGD